MALQATLRLWLAGTRPTVGMASEGEREGEGRGRRRRQWWLQLLSSSSLGPFHQMTAQEGAGHTPCGQTILPAPAPTPEITFQPFPLALQGLFTHF